MKKTGATNGSSSLKIDYPPKGHPSRELWSKVLSGMRDDFTPVAYDTWFKHIQPFALEGNKLTLYTRDKTTKTTVDHRYLPKVKDFLKRTTGIDYDITLNLEDGGSGDDDPAPVLPSNLKSRYTFESFVKGKSNELAYAASMAVAEAPGKTSYNPLFLYGGVGLGKTHLMHSIGNFILDIDPYSKVYYTSSESLVNDFIASLRNHSAEQFRDKYRSLDLLMVDDVQFLMQKDRSQEEFFHTFNALFFSNKQIVLSSDKHPSELKDLEERLSSRFSSGLVVDITRPDYETRLAILQKKAEYENIPIPPDILQHIASNISSNIRDLEGAFNKVIAQAKLTKVPITIDLAVEAVRDIAQAAEKREIDIPYIQEVVSAFYNVTPDEIRSKRRTANLSLARHVAMYLIRKILDSQLPSIGNFFGGRDHSTVVHAIDKINELMDADPGLVNKIDDLEKRIRDRT
ncbi:MAG: chromosomal replication initiator protein DnaA [Clostridiales bacterium]|jgi:chromosomal replication initiator protein|nr:chromosomal replication initiator protein DnaA [Clostridiales bacterium]